MTPRTRNTLIATMVGMMALGVGVMLRRNQEA